MTRFPAAAAAATALLAAACATAPRPAVPGSAAAAPAARANPLADEGYEFPIEGGALPSAENLLPNAERSYRGGVHEGVDIYRMANGEAIPCGCPVRNARAGWVVRADHDWMLMTAPEYERITAALKETPDETMLDRLRGRQVWVRAADGTVVRYCHLASVRPDIVPGVKVGRGVLIGTVGNTGTRASVQGAARDCHLHFEIWPTPSDYLGKGQSPRRAGERYAELLGTRLAP